MQELPSGQGTIPSKLQYRSALIPCSFMSFTIEVIVFFGIGPMNVCLGMTDMTFALINVSYVINIINVREGDVTF